MIISIIMSVHNEELYIRNSIESILKQKYKDFELIIVDDGSTDKTSEIISVYLKDPRIKFIKNRKIGKVEAFNIGFNNSKGHYICFFHGDDIMTNDSIVSRFNKIKKYSNIPVAIAGKLKTISNTKKFDGIIIPRSNYATFSGQSIMFNRLLGNKIFPIPKNLPNEDYWMRLHIESFAQKILHSKEIVALYRIHENNSFLSTDTIMNFNQKNEKIHERRIKVGREFLNKYKDDLNKHFFENLTNYIKAEEYRYNGNFLKLLFCNLKLKKKINFIIESNYIFYKIKNIYPRFFIGRG